MTRNTKWLVLALTTGGMMFQFFGCGGGNVFRKSLQIGYGAFVAEGGVILADALARALGVPWAPLPLGT